MLLVTLHIILLTSNLTLPLTSLRKTFALNAWFFANDYDVCVITEEGRILTFPFENARYNGNLKIFPKKSQYIIFNEGRLILKVDRYDYKAADSNYDLTTNLQGKRPGYEEWNSTSI